MLIEQLRNEEHFTNHEKDVAHFILDNIDEVSNMTSEQLAKSAVGKNHLHKIIDAPVPKNSD